jgi:GNAT superfamily N-acetyltransferase
METTIIREKEKILRFLSMEPELQLYLIGDLDEFYWPHTTWYALSDNNKILAIGLLYSGMNPPTFLLFQNKDENYAAELINAVRQELPERFYVHLSPGLLEVFGKQNVIEDFGQNLRMILKHDPGKVEDENIQKLTEADIDQITDFYKSSYPFNWFDKRMLETGKYYGYFIEGILKGIAGVHVYSEQYRIAALGNIATHPDFRGRKIANKLTTYLCNDIKSSVDIIGLNVKSNNIPAIKCYENIGFEIICRYDECLIHNK